MPKQKKERANIQEKIVRVFKSLESDDGNLKTDLRLVSWIVNGKETPIKLEKRDLRKDRNGEWRPGKCKGLSDSDVIFIIENADDIGRHMGFNADKFMEKAVQPF